MKILRIVLLIALVVIMLSGCHKQQDSYPEKVSESIWISRNAKDIKKVIIQGTYQVYYSTPDCYPPEQFLKNLEKAMSEKGWKRLKYDFLNPTIETSPNRMPGGLWSHITRKGKHEHMWIDDWQDPTNNTIRYDLKYEGDSLQQLEKSCHLNVTVIYTPIEILRRNLPDLTDEKRENNLAE